MCVYEREREREREKRVRYKARQRLCGTSEPVLSAPDGRFFMLVPSHVAYV